MIDDFLNNICSNINKKQILSNDLIEYWKNIIDNNTKENKIMSDESQKEFVELLKNFDGDELTVNLGKYFKRYLDGNIFFNDSEIPYNKDIELKLKSGLIIRDTKNTFLDFITGNLSKIKLVKLNNNAKYPNQEKSDIWKDISFTRLKVVINKKYIKNDRLLHNKITLQKENGFFIVPNGDISTFNYFNILSDGMKKYGPSFMQYIIKFRNIEDQILLTNLFFENEKKKKN